MYKRVWLCRCEGCDLVYGFSNQEITINDDGEPCRDISAKDEVDLARIFCRVCGYPLELLQQVGEW